MQIFANLLHDETFKIVVGAPGNEPLVIKFIEMLIPGKKILELTNLDKENHGLVISDKNTTFDLFCTSEEGEQFIVEMQFSGQATFKERMLVYATYPIRAQMDKRLKEIEKLASGDKECHDVSGKKPDKMYYGLNPIYVISLLNFSLPHENNGALEEGMISRYSIRNDRNGELMTEALHFIFLELGRLGLRKRDSAKCKTPLQKVAYSLKYMHELAAAPEGFDDEFQRMLYKASELTGMTQEQRRQYDRAMTTKIDIIAQQDYAREEGLAEGLKRGQRQGRQEGRAEGAELKSEEIARKMIDSNIPYETIRLCTGLSDAKIRSLME